MLPIRGTTQEHLDIEEIKDDLVLLKNGNVVAVLETTSVNFDLLSEREQDAMIAAYSGLLNSLSFPLQVVVRSKRMDISNYLNSLSKVEKIQKNPKLKERIKSYKEFVQNLTTKGEVLDKSFYVVVPFAEVRLISSTSPVKKLLGKKEEISFDRNEVLERATINLAPKIDHIIKQLGKVGLKAHQLKTAELIELFYDIYNPEASKEQKRQIRTGVFSTPVVQKAAEKRSHETA